MLTCVEDSKPIQAECDYFGAPVLIAQKTSRLVVFQAAQSRWLCQVQPPVVRSFAVVMTRSYCDSTWLACHTVGCSQALSGKLGHVGRKPPQTPTQTPTMRKTRGACGKSHLSANNSANTPIKNEPATLMISVPQYETLVLACFRPQCTNLILGVACFTFEARLARDRDS